MCVEAWNRVQTYKGSLTALFAGNLFRRNWTQKAGLKELTRPEEAGWTWYPRPEVKNM